jgi:hypothetical protein
MVKVTAWNKLNGGISGGPVESQGVTLELLDPVEKVSIVGSQTTLKDQGEGHGGQSNETQFEVQFSRGTDVSCAWDFGDGTSLFEKHCTYKHVVSHTFKRQARVGREKGCDEVRRDKIRKER